MKPDDRLVELTNTKSTGSIVQVSRCGFLVLALCLSGCAYPNQFRNVSAGQPHAILTVESARLHIGAINDQPTSFWRCGDSFRIPACPTIVHATYSVWDAYGYAPIKFNATAGNRYVLRRHLTDGRDYMTLSEMGATSGLERVIAEADTRQRKSVSGRSDSSDCAGLDQLPHLIVALREYYENLHRWPDNPNRLADFVHENRHQWPEHWQEPKVCIPGNPNKFDLGRFSELTFQSQPDGKLSVHFVVDLPLPRAASGTLTVEQPE